MILEMSRRDMSEIVDKQALAVVLHSVAGQTESGSFGTSHFSGHAQKSAKDGQAENGDKGARIFPPRLAVMAGRIRITAMSAALKRIRQRIRVVA